MANIWFCRDGHAPTVGELVAKLPIAECRDKLAITTNSVRTGIIQANSVSNRAPVRPAFRDFHHVVVEIDAAEAGSTMGLKAGFYLSPLMPLEVAEKLGIE